MVDFVAPICAVELWDFAPRAARLIARQRSAATRSRFSVTWQLVVWTGVIFLTLAALGRATAEPSRVLFLHSFGREFSPWNEFARSIRAELVRQSSRPLDIYDAFLATARFAEDKEEAPFVEYLAALFAERRLDLVITIGAPAQRFVQRYRPQLFPSTPMLVTTVEQRRVQTLTANDAVVAIRLDLPGMFENILQLRPQTTTIAVVIGNSFPEKSWVEELRRHAQPITDRVRFVWLNELPLAEIQRRTATLPSASAIFFAPPSVDAAGVVYEEDGALARIHAVANAPMFSYVDGFLGQGIVGGLLISLPDTSRQVASVAFRILQGDAPDRITTPPIEAKPAFDWRELKRWNISENSLPAGSEIRFRTPTVWEQYNIQIIAVAAAILMQSILITGLLFEGHRRRLAEFKSRQRLMDMAHMDRAASAGALSASIAHELNQPLGAILSNAEAAEMLLSGKIPDVDQVMDILADIRRDDERAGEIIKRLRGLLKKEEIRLQAIDLNDLIDDVLRLLLPEAAKRGVALMTHRENAALSVLADRVHLQQVVLNLAINGMDAMLNCPRRMLTVGTSRFSESEIELSVADTGPGIPKDRLKGIFEWFFTTKDQGTGLGLSIARTLIETYGGRIWAENREAGGAVFRFTLPLTKAH